MKLKAKILILAVTVVTIIAMNCIVLMHSVKAANLMELSSIDLHYGGMCEQLLKYKGVTVKTTYVEYYGDDGKNYPAYCMDKSLPRSNR